MGRPRTEIRLFPGQFAALREDAAELLVGSRDPGTPAGASYALRALAVRVCAAGPGNCHVVLVQRNEADLGRVHLSGVNGLPAMVREMQTAGFAAVSLAGNEIRFGNGSTLRWSGCSRDSEVSTLLDRRIDVLIVDEADDLPETVFERLRDAVMASVHPLRRVIAAARSTSAGWVGRHWEVNGDSGRRVCLLDPADLDPELIKRPSFPSYAEWLRRHFERDFRWVPHVEAVVGAIDRWINGEFDHLAIFMPSQHGKSEAGPRRAIPYILARFPTDWTAIVSYATQISNSRSADARENYRRTGGELQPGRQPVRQWLTVGGGGCWSAGLAAGFAGNPNTWGFMDDPDKDWEDAVNRGKQEKKRRRYGSVFRARESMFAEGDRPQKVCATVTRWDPEDTVGYALQTSHAALAAEPEEAREKWGILALPALYDPGIAEGYRRLYPLFEVLPDFRTTPGEPIYAKRRSAKAWNAVKVIRGPIIFSCECQQEPTGVERGGHFEIEWFIRKDRDPAFAGEKANEGVWAACCRAWDLAATEGAGDWTAGVKMGRLAEDGSIYVRHVVRARFAPVGVKQLVAAMMILDGPTVKIRLPIDPAAGGVAQADAIVRYLRLVGSWLGISVPPIVADRPRKGATATLSAKAARGRAFQSLAQPPSKELPGGVSYVAASWEPSPSNLVPDFSTRIEKHPELREIARICELAAGDWWNPWLKELRAFTGVEGREDDQADATFDAHEEVFVPRAVASGASVGVPGWQW
jgi:phage terminase large subunit-like protein